MKTICIMQCHTDSKIRYDVIAHNLKYISEVCDHLVITNSEEFDFGVLENKLSAYADKIKIEFKYYPNDHTICAGKLLEYLNENIDFVQSFDRCIVTNDSFILCNTLTLFKQFIESSEHELYGLITSRERRYHYPDFLRAYNQKGIKILHDYMSDRLHECSNYESVSQVIEIDSTYAFEDIIALYNLDLRYKKNIHFDPDNLRNLMEKEAYPIIKLKTLNLTKHNKIQKNTLPEDFDAFQYRRLHKDLSNMDDIDIKKHFLQFGRSEGRKYKNSQKSVLQSWMKPFIEKTIPQLLEKITFED